MKKILLFTVTFLFVVLAFGQPINTINIPLRGLEKAIGEFYIPTTNAQGVQVYQRGITVNLSPIAFTPTPTGNTSNFQEFVIDPNGDLFFIDYFGNSIQLNIGSGGGADTDVSQFGLNGSLDSLVLVEDANRFAVALTDLSTDTDVSFFGINTSNDSLVLTEGGTRFSVAKSDIAIDDFYHVLQDTIRQVAHGFTLDNFNTPFIPVRWNNSTSLFELASTFSQDDLPWTYIVEIVNADSFICQPLGPLWNRQHTLTVGQWLFLQDDGTYNSVEADSQFNVVIAATYDNNNIWLYDNRPTIGTAETGGNDFSLFANQALSIDGDTVKFGRETRANAQLFSGGRYIQPKDTSSFIEIYDTSTIGRNRYPFNLASLNFPENGHFGLRIINATSGVSGHLVLSNNTLRLDGEQGLQLTYQYDARLGILQNNLLSYRPFMFNEFNLTGISVPASQGSIAVSDGTRVGTQSNQLYYFTENENEVPLTIKVHSDNLTEFDVPLQFGQTAWAWTVPSFFDGYRILSVEHTFVSAGTNDTNLALDRGGVIIGLYNATLTAGSRSVRVETASPLIISTGDVIRGRVPSGIVGTPAEGWTMTLELLKN